MYHRCELTCQCGYFHGIVYDVCACNLCDWTVETTHICMTQIWVVSTIQFWQRHTGYTRKRHTKSRGNIHTNKSVCSGEISLNYHQEIHTTCVSRSLETWHPDPSLISGRKLQVVAYQIWGSIVSVTSTVIQFRAVLLTLASIATADPTIEGTCS